jgi:uncharacterized membrane protein
VNQTGRAGISRYTTPSREDAETEFNRVVAFSDGVFAIAITLLVLTLEIPGGVDDLDQELRDRAEEFFAYALSFAVLGKFWITHHSFFGSLARFNARLMVLNLLYLAFIALVPFTSDLLGDYSNDTVAVIMYALNMAAITGIFATTVRYSLRHELIREWAKPHTRRLAGWTQYTITAVFLISCPIALLSPTAAIVVWLSIFLFGSRLLDVMAVKPPDESDGD